MAVRSFSLASFLQHKVNACHGLPGAGHMPEQPSISKEQELEDAKKARVNAEIDHDISKLRQKAARIRKQSAKALEQSRKLELEAMELEKKALGLEKKKIY